MSGCVTSMTTICALSDEPDWLYLLFQDKIQRGRIAWHAMHGLAERQLVSQVKHESTMKTWRPIPENKCPESINHRIVFPSWLPIVQVSYTNTYNKTLRRWMKPYFNSTQSFSVLLTLIGMPHGMTNLWFLPRAIRSAAENAAIGVGDSLWSPFCPLMPGIRNDG